MTPLLVFDIETVPDVDYGRRLLDLPTLPDVEVARAMFALQRARTGSEFTLAPEGFHESFCADIPAADAAFFALSQRPLAGVALTEPAPAPAWRSHPVWAVLPTADRCIDPGVHHFSYERMDASVTEIEGASHVVMISHPKEVAQVVMSAVHACAMQPA